MSVNMNRNYAALETNYLFAGIRKRVEQFRAAHPGEEIIRLGIGDVTRPLSENVTAAMSAAALGMSTPEGFHGYGAEQGCDFLKDAVRRYYEKRGVCLNCDEIFISDGAKSDCGNITDLFDADNTVLIPDPVYPVYVDTNIMDGRWIRFIPADESNDFLPVPSAGTEGDIIYICSPNNPTGAVYDRERLTEWVDFANRHGSIILFDAAYESFIRDEGLPHSIFEIPGARTCAVEICSLSKTAGFTGTRCGYTVIPKELVRGGFSLNAMWERRQCTKYNGTAYVIQRGAEAVFTPEGQRKAAENIRYYQENAAVITETLDRMGVTYTGGRNAPYIWMKCPDGMGSWEFFDVLLEKCRIVGTPGAGFGRQGEGWLRLSSFGDRKQTEEAMRRIRRIAF